jgi:hypothetical protein
VTIAIRAAEGIFQILTFSAVFCLSTVYCTVRFEVLYRTRGHVGFARFLVHLHYQYVYSRYKQAFTPHCSVAENLLNEVGIKKTPK